MKKFVVALLVALVLYFAVASTVRADREPDGIPYWSCHRETYYVWVGWPTFIEKRTRTVCEVKEWND